MGTNDHDAFEARQGRRPTYAGRSVAGSRTTGFRSRALDGNPDTKDPSRVIMFVVFESEEKARERENDSRRQEGLQAASATMTEIFEGAPEFTDLTVVDDWSL